MRIYFGFIIFLLSILVKSQIIIRDTVYIIEKVYIRDTVYIVDKSNTDFPERSYLINIDTISKSVIEKIEFKEKKNDSSIIKRNNVSVLFHINTLYVNYERLTALEGHYLQYNKTLYSKIFKYFYQNYQVSIGREKADFNFKSTIENPSEIIESETQILSLLLGYRISYRVGIVTLQIGCSAGLSLLSVDNKGISTDFSYNKSSIVLNLEPNLEIKLSLLKILSIHFGIDQNYYTLKNVNQYPADIANKLPWITNSNKNIGLSIGVGYSF